MPLPELSKSLPERSLVKEKSVENKLGTAIGDLARDIGTANTMAKEKFDGDTALMHAARGGVTAMIGAGLKLAIDNVWNEAVSGRPLYVGRNQFNFGPNFKETNCEICGKKFLTEIWYGVKRDSICDECIFKEALEK